MPSILAWLVKIYNYLTGIAGNLTVTHQTLNKVQAHTNQLITEQASLKLEVDDVEGKLKHIISELNAIKLVLGIGVPVVEYIQFENQGENMPASITDIQTVAVASVNAVDAAGEPVPVDTTKITWTVGDPTLLTITLDPTTGLPTFGFNQGVFTGTLPATSQVTGQDTVNNLTSQDTVTVNLSAATSETISFAPPTP